MHCRLCFGLAQLWHCIDLHPLSMPLQLKIDIEAFTLHGATFRSTTTQHLDPNAVSKGPLEVCHSCHPLFILDS